MIKTVLAASFAMFVATTANAGVFDDFKAGLKDAVQNFPAHQQNGYRDTGCDELQFTDVVNDEGVVLYRNNMTCISGAGDQGAIDPQFTARAPQSVKEEGNGGCSKDGKGKGKH